ncbi:MAG: BTAD domain-containing putative transcriptional regulator [Anaerolineae bacterium]
MPSSRLFMFGPVRLERDDNTTPGLESRKALALLCYLVARRERISRPHLVDMFWGDMTEERGRHNLRRVLSNIGACLPAWLEVDRHTVRYTPGPNTWDDISAAEQLRAEGTADALAAAVELMRGDLLADLSLDSCPEFETWLIVEREHWRQRCGEMIERLIDYREQENDLTRGIAIAERLVALDPWREEGHRALMRLLALNGERNAALAAYDACRRVLAEELQVEPTSETRGLRDQIIAGEIGPKVVSATSHNLPAPLTPFIGREPELDELVRLLDPASPNRLVTVMGLGGMGKSRLALETGHRLWQRYAHGAYLAPLESATGPEFVVFAIAAALDLRFEGPTDPRAQLLGYLRDKALLLILDGFEQHLAAVDLIIDILRAAVGVKILVTSRAALHLHAEQVFDVDGLPFPTEDDPGAAEYASVRLFVQGAQRAQRRFQPSAANLPAIYRICRTLRGLPLGIELAASLVGTESCQDLAVEITRDLDAISTTMRDIPPAHRSLRAVFEHSWSLLTADERVALTGLAVFAGGFDRTAAHQVAGASARMLTALGAKSLLTKRESEGELGVRFDMHTLVRQYALDKLERAESYDALMSRYLDFYVALAEESETQLIGANQATWWKRVSVEHDNIRHALVWGLEHNPDAALRLAGALWRFWFERCYYEEAETWLTRVLVAARDSSAVARAKALFGASRISHAQGDIDEAWRLLEQALPLAREGGDLGLLALTASDLGWRRYERGERESAKALWAEALQVAQQAKDGWLVAVVTASLGEAALNDGDLERAASLFAESTSLARSLGDSLLLAFHLALLARVRAGQGDSAGATACLLESLDIRQEYGNKANIAACLEGLAAVAATERRPAALSWAVQLLGAAEALRDAVHTPIPPVECPAYTSTVDALRAKLPDADFAKAWAAGRALSLDGEIALAHAAPEVETRSPNQATQPGKA